MVSAAVTQRFGLIAGEARNDDQLVAERFQRREHQREFELGADPPRQPLIVDYAVWMVDDAQSTHRFRRCVLSGCQRRHHCIQQGQGDRRADPAKHGPARDGFLCDDHEPDLLI